MQYIKPPIFHGYHLWICKFSGGYKWDVEFWHADGVELTRSACVDRAAEYRERIAPS